MMHWLIRHHRPIWVAVALSVIGAAVAAYRLPVDADVLSMLSPEDPDLKAYRDAEEALPITSTFVAVVPSAETAALREAARDLDDLPEVANTLVMPAAKDETLLIGRLKKTTFDLNTVRSAVGKIRGVFDRRRLKYGLTGTPVVLLEGTDWVWEDIQLAQFIAMALLAVFFVVFDRDSLLAVLSALPVAAGLIWALGCWSIAGQRLTLLAAMVPTLAMGLGVDYTMHLVTAVREGLRGGGDRREAIARESGRVCRPMAVGAVTTAAGFASLITARTPGLVHVGWVGTLATLGIFVATLLIIPPILLLVPEKWLRSRRSVVSRLMSRVAAVVPRRRWAIIVGFVGLIGAAAVLAPRFRLETDYTRFENLNRPARRLQDRLLREAGVCPGPVVLLFRSVNEAEAFGQAYLSDAAAFPSIRRLDFARRGPLGLAPPLQLPDGRAAALVSPVDNAFSITAYHALRADLERLIQAAKHPPQVVTGAPVLNSRVSDLFRRDVMAVLAVAAGAVVVMLVVGMGSVRLALLALVPLVCGLGWMVGTLAAVGQNLCLAGAMVAPLVLGIGVDNGVHVLARWRQTGGNLDTVLSGVGRAVFGATATTVCAAGAFVLTRSPALVQVGWLISLGLTGSLVASVLLLPALGRAWGGRLFGRAAAPAQPHGEAGTFPPTP